MYKENHGIFLLIKNVSWIIRLRNKEVSYVCLLILQYLFHTYDVTVTYYYVTALYMFESCDILYTEKL